MTNIPKALCPTPRTRQVFDRGLYFFFILLTVALVGKNSFALSQEITRYLKIRRYIPPQFPGLKFRGLNEVLPGVEFIGYYTDKNLDDMANATQFAQAQYVLAPIILLKGHEDFPYVIFDCTSPEVALKKIAELKFIAVKKNPFGIILARNPKLTAGPWQRRP